MSQELPREALEAPLELVVEALQDAIQDNAIAEKDLVFIKSLLRQQDTWSSNQAWWARFMYGVTLGLIERHHKTQVALGDLGPVYAMFDLAKQNVKYPAIVLQTTLGQLVLKPAGEHAKVPGSLNVTDGKPYGQNQWFGRILKSGVWEQNTKVNSESLAAVHETLKQLAADPVGTAQKHAKLTGCCCFCNSKLTDKRSTAAGFGPVCAKNFGLYPKWKEVTAVFDTLEKAV